MAQTDLMGAHNDSIDRMRMLNEAAHRGWYLVSVNGKAIWLHDHCALTAPGDQPPPNPCPRCEARAAARATAPKQGPLI